MRTLTKTEKEIINELKEKSETTITYFTGSRRIRGAMGSSGKRKYNAAKKLIEDGLVTLIEKYNSGYGYNLIISAVN